VENREVGQAGVHFQHEAEGAEPSLSSALDRSKKLGRTTTAQQGTGETTAQWTS
jgi:hypothetical protein